MINIHDHPFLWPVLNFQSTDVNGLSFDLKKRVGEMRPAGSALWSYHQLVSGFSGTSLVFHHLQNWKKYDPEMQPKCPRVLSRAGFVPV